jgi:chorismate mutase
MKHPEDCESIGDVRQAIDALDREIIHLIEDLYRTLVSYFIDRDMHQWRKT